MTLEETITNITNKIEQVQTKVETLKREKKDLVENNKRLIEANVKLAEEKASQVNCNDYVTAAVNASEEKFIEELKALSDKLNDIEF